MLEVSTNSMCFDTVASTSRPKNELARSDMTQVVALAVITRLHDWCVQLFWITVFCVMGVCGDEESRTSIYQLHEKQQQQQSLTRKRTSIAEIEMKLLRHITSAIADDSRRDKVVGKNDSALVARLHPQLFLILRSVLRN
ncbi:hypothetical protein OSTOST_14232 [Ostertagia ostertagi]